MLRRHWKRWLIGAVAAVAVLAVGGPFVFIHFIEGPAKPKLALPAKSPPASTGTATSGTVATSSVAGTWKVSAGSQAGYRVQEVLAGQSATAVGRTSSVTGQFQISGTQVVSASFTVDMASVVSNQSQRNAQFDGRIMDVSTYPTATFRLTQPIPLDPIPSVGQTIHVSATGELTLHGVTRQITIPLSAQRLSSSIEVLGDADITFADWRIANPSVAGFVTTADHGTLEVLLRLNKA
ncbi:MAG: YceI family protein [Acidimicrobiales bacterium]